MVLFVDLGDDDEESSTLNHDHAIHTAGLQRLRLAEPVDGIQATNIHGDGDQDEHPSYNGFSAVLSCYPFALGLAGNLDLNDLYSLSLTSKAIHKSLIQFRNNLVTRSLHCSNDTTPLLIDLVRHNNLTISDFVRTAGITHGQPAPKLRTCARDLVAPCRKCNTVVCRNCAAKPPSPRCLKDRYRRLCGSCLVAPLAAHLLPTPPEKDPPDTSPLSSSASSTRSISSSSSSSSSSPQLRTYSAFLHTPCTCPTLGAYLCAPCGANLRANDTTYQRVWTWRSRYSTHIGGGLGTGLGEGDQGQKCGKGAGCLEACKEGKGMCWVEIDCCEGEGEDGVVVGNEIEGGGGIEGLVVASTSASMLVEERPGTPRADQGPGYHRQEVEGLGGVMKKKVKKRVKVGATVWEYDDERESGRYLEREATGLQRSWCAWCERVILGKGDLEGEVEA